MTTENKKFTKNDEGFVCGHCGKNVPPLGFTSRNHCPYCLYSLHVDVNPGDRANSCGALMRPVMSEPHPRKGYIITHECLACGKRVKNRAAYGAGNEQDNIELLIALSAGQL